MTSRRLAGADFPEQLARVAEAGVDAVILREKDLDEAAYEELAKDAAAVCRAADVPLVLHTRSRAAQALGIRRIHLPCPVFLAMEEAERQRFDVKGVSVHSVEEAVLAAEKGASYLTAGHIFATDCKKGLPPRGLPFLQEVCRAVQIPVYAIGGITPENAKACIRAGAAGICLMSSLMKAEEPKRLLSRIRDCIL